MNIVIFAVLTVVGVATGLLCNYVMPLKFKTCFYHKDGEVFTTEPPKAAIDSLLGIVGALIGGLLTSINVTNVSVNPGMLVAAFFGAVFLLAFLRALMK